MASMWPSTVWRFAPIVTTDMWLPPSLAPRRNIARPLVVPATVLLDGLEAECIGIPSELEQLSHNPRLDLDRLGLSPARKTAETTAALYRAKYMVGEAVSRI